MAEWKKEHDPNPFIEKLKSTCSINEDGRVQFSGMDILVVPSQLENTVKLNRLVTQEDKHIIVWSAIRNAGKKGKLSASSVMTEIAKLEKEYLSKKEQRYKLITTLSVDPRRHRLPNLYVDSTWITFSPKTINKFIKYINKSPNLQLHIYENKIPRDYMWVMVTVLAKGIHDAVQRALRTLNLVRGELNYLINYGSRTFFSVNKPKPINKIRYGPVHTLHNHGGKLVDDLFWYEEESYELIKAYRDTSGNFEKRVAFLPKFRKQLNKSKIKDVLEDAILLYNNALDSFNFDTVFIKLWTTLELLTGTERDSYSVTVKRTAFVFKNPEIIKNHLNILRECRNNLVHKGYMEGQKEIFLYDLKLYVEELIHFLLWRIKNVKNFEEVKQLLDSSPEKQNLVQGQKELECKLRINKIAQKFRG